MEFIWRERLKGEEEGVDTMQGINKVLLENLLPAHVATHFLSIIKVNLWKNWILFNLLRMTFHDHLLKALTQFDADNSLSLE